MTSKFSNRKSGYSIIELLFYLAIFTVLSIALINTIITMLKAFKISSNNTDMVQSVNIIQRMSREIRQANGVYSINPTDLVLDTRDDSGSAKQIRFVLSGTDIQLYETTPPSTVLVLVGNLNPDNIVVSSLDFKLITTAKGSAVRMYYQAKPESSSSAPESFYHTVVLRGDY